MSETATQGGFTRSEPVAANLAIAAVAVATGTAGVTATTEGSEVPTALLAVTDTE